MKLRAAANLIHMDQRQGGASAVRRGSLETESEPAGDGERERSLVSEF